jgi:hypothetical protein
MKLSGISGALLAIVLPFAMSGVASACPDTTMTLTLAGPEGDPKSVQLTCEPTGGSHPNADSACAEILAAHGDFDGLPGEFEQTACTMEYRPVTAVVDGTWRGEPVSWQSEYGNSCTLRNATGTVFLF